MQRGILDAPGLTSDRGNFPAADSPEVRSIQDALEVSVCWACNGDAKPLPLLVLLRSFPKAGEAGPFWRGPHVFLMACPACRRVQLDVRDESDGAGHGFDVADSARLVDAALACPQPLSQDCPCAVHGSLKQLPALQTGVGRYPDPALYDLPRYTLAAGDGVRVVARTGKVATRYGANTPKAEGELVGGVEHGNWTLWHDNGNRKSAGEYAHGLRTGAWTHWLRSGHLQAKETWRDGERTSIAHDPRAVIEEALHTSTCLACASDKLDVAMLIERRGIAPQLEGHVIAYDHKVIVRCAACGAGQLDQRAKDSADRESGTEQGTAFAIDEAGIARLAEAAKTCPDPHSENCRCAIHASLKKSIGVLPGNPDSEFHHVPCLTLDAGGKGLRLLALSGRFVSHFPGGATRSHVAMVKGALEGRCTRWHPNGQKASEGDMRGGAREGRWIEWDEQGQVCYDREWRRGCTVS